MRRIRIAALAFTTAATAIALARPASAQVDFVSPRIVPCGAYPTSVATSDFDADGHLDLATGPASVVYGDGEGNFAPRRTFGTPSWRVVAHDFDDDGLEDLAIVDEEGLAVHRSLGASGFGGRIRLETRIVPFAVAVGDLDRDGRTDLAVAGGRAPGTRFVATLLGDGSGGFSASQVFPCDAVEYYGHLKCGDVDSDGDDDVLVAGVGVVFLESLGSGRLAAPREIVLGESGYSSLALADMDTDGRLDLAVVALYGDLSSYLGDGASGFALADTVSIPSYEQAIVVADIDGQSGSDIVFRGGYVPGDGRGGLGVVTVVVGGGRESDGVVTGDFDEDGLVDFASTGSFGVTVFVARAPGLFLSSNGFVAGNYTSSVALGDLDEDGHVDAVLPEYGANSGDRGGVVVLRGAGDGSFGARAFFEGPYRPYFPRLADLDSDGHLDVGLVTPYSGWVEWLFGDGAGGLGRGAYFSVSHTATDLAIGDLDRDGNLDVVVASYYGDLIASVLLGDGTGGLGAATAFPAVAPPWSVSLADLDGDCLLDVAGGGASGQAISIWRGDGAGGLGPAASFPAGSSPISVAVADFDGDGIPDVATGNRDSSDVSVLLGDGTGAFSPIGSFAAGSGASWIVVEDFDRDGALDVAAMYAGVTVLLGEGDGRLHPKFDCFGSGGGARTIGTADCDEDGYPDLAVPSGGLGVRLNRTPLDPIASRSGNVEAGVGPPVDVLFVNGSRGDGLERRLALGPTDPLTISMEKPPSAEKPSARFALYAWAKTPKRSTVRELPLGLGASSMPTPLSGGKPSPREIWNNLGRPARLGVPTLPSSAAPSIVLHRPGGVGREIRFFLQGFIVDAAAPNGRAAVTNGVEVSVR